MIFLALATVSTALLSDCRRVKAPRGNGDDVAYRGEAPRRFSEEDAQVYRESQGLLWDMLGRERDVLREMDEILRESYRRGYFTKDDSDAIAALRREASR